MTTASGIPMPPLEMRACVGLTDTAEYDNPSGTPIYSEFGLPLEAYDTVFDFGCGCGRLARCLLQQTPKPRRYEGIDAHRGLVEWCRANLSPLDPNFRFRHHDTYSPLYAPGNSLRLGLPFPVNDATFSLMIANSVFTHLTRSQAEYYLSETARILTPDGIAFTTWFFFDRASFPFLPDVYSLHTSEADFSQAVLFDREWFLASVRNLGLGVWMTRPPKSAGRQWRVFLAKRTPDMLDQFPLGPDGAEWVCGATLKPMAETSKVETLPVLRVGSRRPEPPPLVGALAQVDAMRRSWAWRVGRGLTSPVRTLRRWF